MTFSNVFFLYTFFGDYMKVYIDLVFLLNCYLDFLLLLTTAITLKRDTSLKRILLGTLVGSLTVFWLFFSMSNFLLFLLKIIMALLMVIVTFKYKDLKYTGINFLYFYMISIVLGGFLYYLNTEFSYTHVGLLFVKHKIYINGIFLLLISPVILIVYLKQQKRIKNNYQLIHKIKIVLKNKQEYVFNGFLDTGNRLVDPITNKPIILLEKGIFDEKNITFYYVPFHSLNNTNLLKCFKPLYIEIENKKFNHYLVGISDKKFNFDGVTCILNYKLMEELS